MAKPKKKAKPAAKSAATKMKPAAQAMTKAVAQPLSKPMAQAMNRPASIGTARPLGVTVLGIIGLLWSLLALIGTASLLTLSAAVVGSMGGIASFGSGVIEISAMLIISIISLIGYILLLKMKRNGWLIVEIFGVISIILSALSLNIIGIVITAIIIGYLYTKRQLFR